MLDLDKLRRDTCDGQGSGCCAIPRALLAILETTPEELAEAMHTATLSDADAVLAYLKRKAGVM